MKNHLLYDVKPAFSVFFVDTEAETAQHLESQLQHHFPDMEMKGSATDIAIAARRIQEARPDIIFFDLQLWRDFRCPPFGNWCQPDFETIILSASEIRLMETMQNGIAGYLMKPVVPESLVLIVQHALHRIQEREELRQNRRFIKSVMQRRLQENSVGIPTIEGYEFLVVNEILRCEALGKFTRVVTRDKSDIVSAHNLGAFRKLLEPYGFFAPHRAYLINLQHMKRYHKEGSIHMVDGAAVPLAKRMKGAFLKLIERL